MFFSTKLKGYYVEQTDHTITLARTSSTLAPMTIEEVRQCPVGDAAALEEAMHAIQPKASPSGYMNACCGVYPVRRVVRRTTLELKKVKEPAYFNELFTSQFRIDPEKYTMQIINAADGTDYDVSKAAGKEVLFCGLPSEDIITAQDALLKAGVFPDQLELGTVATLGALVDYFVLTKSKTPTLVLEIGTDTTHSYIVSSAGVEASRSITQGLDAMVPIVQKELGLKDEESAKKLFYSNTFDFTGMGPILVKKLLKELQSSIGFYEVQTGQSVGQILCTGLPSKLTWLDSAIATALGVGTTKLDLTPWLQSQRITLPDGVVPGGLDVRYLGLLSLMINKPPHTHAVPAEKKD
jgi:hypothetical protein